MDLLVAFVEDNEEGKSFRKSHLIYHSSRSQKSFFMQVGKKEKERSFLFFLSLIKKYKKVYIGFVIKCGISATSKRPKEHFVAFTLHDSYHFSSWLSHCFACSLLAGQNEEMLFPWQDKITVNIIFFPPFFRLPPIHFFSFLLHSCRSPRNNLLYSRFWCNRSHETVRKFVE